MWQTYYTPTSVDEALRLLAEHGPEARIIAGGTDLLIELQRGVRQARVLIDVTRICNLDQVHLDDGLVHVGPTVTHNLAYASDLLVERGFPLALACWRVGTPQLRNRGTIAGNLITASPANDTITALWALDGRLTLQSARGERTLSCADFYQGMRQTALAPDEMVTDIAFPALGANQRGTFAKLALRRTHAISVVNAAAVLTFASPPRGGRPPLRGGAGDRSPTVTRARITLGSVAPTVIRAPEAEGALVGAPLSEERIAEAAGLAAQATACIDDIRAARWFDRAHHRWFGRAHHRASRAAPRPADAVGAYRWPLPASGRQDGVPSRRRPRADRVHGQREERRRPGGKRQDAARDAARRPGADRHEGGLRRGGVRGVHGVDGRDRRAGLPDARAPRPRHANRHRRGAGTGRRAPPGAAGVYRRRRGSVRLLYAGIHHGRRQPAGGDPPPHPRADRRRADRQPVPVYGVLQDRAGGGEGG